MTGSAKALRSDVTPAGRHFGISAEHRRECLDWMIPMSEAHLRSIL
jgi:hypothetical protein